MTLLLIKIEALKEDLEANQRSADPHSADVIDAANKWLTMKQKQRLYSKNYWADPVKREKIKDKMKIWRSNEENRAKNEGYRKKY